jgi:hypothetical protein
MKKTIIIISVLLLTACTTNPSNMKITSSAFENQGQIPSKYTCDGEDINPPLKFENVPKQAQTLALIADDPDAPSGTWVHWTIWNIPVSADGIAEGAKPLGIEGMTSFGSKGYGGPCPPSGSHRYFFKLYALDTELNLDTDADKEALESAMQGHIIEQAELMGNYSRS